MSRAREVRLIYWPLLQLRPAIGATLAAKCPGTVGAAVRTRCSGGISTRSARRSERAWNVTPQMYAVLSYHVCMPEPKRSRVCAATLHVLLHAFTSPRSRPMISSVSVERACVRLAVISASPGSHEVKQAHGWDGGNRNKQRRAWRTVRHGRRRSAFALSPESLR